MIGKLKGRVDIVGEDKIILDVNGVGYNIYISSRLLNSLNKDEDVSFFIETIVREDYIHLYGFKDDNDRLWFNELCKVKGVSSKIALKILSHLSINDIISSVNLGDHTKFSQISGIGPKLAGRISSELKGSIKKLCSNNDFVHNQSNNKEK